jgi:toxin YoeB
VLEIIEIIKKDPFAFPPEYEILRGKLKGFISRKINKQHRFVYLVDEKSKSIKILKM